MKGEVLLVDDSPDDAELLRIAAREAGIANPIRTTESGEEALELLLEKGLTPALIVLDIKMPGIDGLEVLRRLRAAPSLRAALVIVLTGSDLDGDRLEALSLGCSAFITKPKSLAGSLEVARRIKDFLS